MLLYIGILLILLKMLAMIILSLHLAEEPSVLSQIILTARYA